MHHLLLKTGVVAGACAFAFLAAPGPAKAVSPLGLDEARSLVVPVVDQEDLSVEEDLRPDEPPEALEGESRRNQRWHRWHRLPRRWKAKAPAMSKTR